MLDFLISEKLNLILKSLVSFAILYIFTLNFDLVRFF